MSLEWTHIDPPPMTSCYRSRHKHRLLWVFLSLSNRRRGMDGSSRLGLNPTNTQVMWMGSKQRLQKIDIGEIPVMSSTVRREILESSLTAAFQWLIRSALFAVLPTTSSVSCVQWHSAWHQRRPRQQFRRSSPVVSTIVTPYCTFLKFFRSSIGVRCLA